jgi:hypothetical protein
VASVRDPQRCSSSESSAGSDPEACYTMHIESPARRQFAYVAGVDIAPEHELDGADTELDGADHELDAELDDDAAQPLLRPGPATAHDLRGGTLTVHPPRPSAPDNAGEDSARCEYVYAYGPGGLAGLAHNRVALACALFASLGGLTFGYDQGVIANVLVMRDFVARWPVGAWERGLMSASSPARNGTRR